MDHLRLSDFAPGVLEMMILRMLATTPLHGYALAKAISDRTLGHLDVDNDALYPYLMRMLASGYLESSWSETPQKRRRRTYYVTVEGRAKLETSLAKYECVVNAVQGVLMTEQHASSVHT